MQLNIGTKPLLVDQANYLDKIDKLAGEVRARFLTVAPGQELTYLMKLNEAKAYPNGSTNWIAAEALATNKTEQQVVDNILANSAAWESVGVVIESARMKAKTLVNVATTVKEMYDAYQTLLSEIDGLYI